MKTHIIKVIDELSVMLHGVVIDEDTQVALAGGWNLCFNIFLQRLDQKLSIKKKLLKLLKLYSN